MTERWIQGIKNGGARAGIVEVEQKLQNVARHHMIKEAVINPRRNLLFAIPAVQLWYHTCIIKATEIQHSLHHYNDKSPNTNLGIVSYQIDMYEDKTRNKYLKKQCSDLDVVSMQSRRWLLKIWFHTETPRRRNKSGPTKPHGFSRILGG